MGLMHTSWLRTRAPHAMTGFVLGASIIAGTASGISAQDASPSAAGCNVEQAVAEAALVYTVDGEQSLATYTVMEELASIGANEVNGTTSAIIGSILFDEDGTPLSCSNFAVDMRTMQTDESRRDNYLRENTLESDTYPFATFVVASVRGVDGPLVEGEATTLQLTGDLTIHGVMPSCQRGDNDQGEAGVAVAAEPPNPGKSENGVTGIRVGSACQGSFPASLARNMP